MWIFDVAYTVGTSVIPGLILLFENDLMTPNFGFSTVAPVFVFVMSDSFLLAFISVTAQIVMSMTVYKKVLMNALWTSSPEFVVEKLVFSNITSIFFVSVLFCIIINAKRKLTRDLAEAKTIAEEALEQQETFIFSFSHELRNPLNSLLGNLQLILMSVISPQTREMVRTCRICAELLLQLVNNILDIGKCSINKLEVDPSVTGVYSLFERVWAISSELISRKKLKSHIKVEKKVPPVMMLDSHRLNQVMMNLIGNAIKFTESGSICVTVEWLTSHSINEGCFEPRPYDSVDEEVKEKNQNLFLMRSSRKNPTNAHLNGYLTLFDDVNKFDMNEVRHARHRTEGVLKIIVGDTGCGMNQAALSKLFQKFSQVSDDVQKRQVGTGLGLYITKEICKKMGGDIRVYSKVGVGTTFVLCIPTVSIVDDNYHSLNNSQDINNQQLSERSFNAIVADDSPFNISLICKFFAKISVRVVKTAGDGLEAYNKYKESIESNESIDMVTLDVQMPKMDGKTVCRKIREYEKQKGIKPAIIILISGNYDERCIRECLHSGSNKGANSFIRKPLMFDDFASKICQLKAMR